MSRRTGLATAATVRRRHLVSGQAEVWSAESADGRWDFERQETAGTPWRATDRTTITPDNPGGAYFLAPSLPAARAITADPAAVAAALQQPARRPDCAFVSTSFGRQRCTEPPAPGHTHCSRHGGTA